jgi:hypothetical protein
MGPSSESLIYWILHPEHHLVHFGGLLNSSLSKKRLAKLAIAIYLLRINNRPELGSESRSDRFARNVAGHALSNIPIDGTS